MTGAAGSARNPPVQLLFGRATTRFQLHLAATVANLLLLAAGVTSEEAVVSWTTLFLRSRVRLSVELAQFSGVLGSYRYSVGHPSGISSALSASLMESAASEVTQFARRSSLLFSHHKAVSFMPAFRFSRRHLPTSL